MSSGKLGNGKIEQRKIGHRENWATGKLGNRRKGNEKIGHLKMRHRKKGNIYVTADIKATGNMGNRKLVNGK